MALAHGGQWTVMIRPHSWLLIDLNGMWDFSPRDECRLAPPQESIRIAGLETLNSLSQHPHLVHIAETGDDIEAACLETSAQQRVALYQPNEWDLAGGGWVDQLDHWINSPLTEQLKRRHGKACYGALVLHLRGLLEGTRMPLASLGQEVLWDRILTRFPEGDAQIKRLCSQATR